MLFGNKEDFAIECYNDSNPVKNKQVFGHMCIWIKGVEYGDITESSCMLNITENHLIHFVKNLKNIEKSSLEDKNDKELYEYLDSKIYMDDNRTDEQIHTDFIKYSKYEFLANGGESFDFGKAFVLKEEDKFRFVFIDKSNFFHCGRINTESVLNVINSFIDWINVEKNG